ncbi:hypothetical protein GQ600_11289 [Phytophthora cactorum]|nr:hypothetical protein GQ600_11289 [Phytophthora cactorum]
MDASDYGLCALDTSSKMALTYQFSDHERGLISEFKSGAPNGTLRCRLHVGPVSASTSQVVDVDVAPWSFAMVIGRLSGCPSAAHFGLHTS